MLSRLNGHWLIILLLQVVAISLLIVLLLLLSFSVAAPDGGVIYDVAMWFLIPVLGFFSSLVAVRAGLNPYAAWVAPAACQTMAHVALTAMPPSSPGMPMIVLLLSVIGAATGDEINRRRTARSDRIRKNKRK